MIITGFHKLSTEEKIKQLLDHEIISTKDIEIINKNKQINTIKQLDNLSENVIAAFPMPYSIATVCKINNHNTVIPMVTEESSVVAAVAKAAKTIRTMHGKITAQCSSMHIQGQIYIDNFDKIYVLIPISQKQKPLDKTSPQKNTSITV